MSWKKEAVFDSQSLCNLFGIILAIGCVIVVSSVIKSKLTERQLINLVRSKKRAGAEALYDLYHRALFLAIIRIVPQKETAEDVLEQTYITVWNTFDQYDPQQVKLLSWMMATARRLASMATKYEIPIKI